MTDTTRRVMEAPASTIAVTTAEDESTRRPGESALAGLMQVGGADPSNPSPAAQTQAWAHRLAQALLLDCWTGEPLRLADFVA